MKSLFSHTQSRRTLLFLVLFATPLIPVRAQDYWSKIPDLTSMCYSEKDGFGKAINELKSDVKAKLEASKKTVEEKANSMTAQERMAFAARYQNMTPDEIVSMQNQMMEMTQMQTDFQLASSEFENRFNQIEAGFREEFGRRLGPIEQEYRKLPDGEGTPQWAIKKGEELTARYNSEYESICNKYFTSPDGVFRVWLRDFSAFLLEQEVPFNRKMIEAQYSQFGITADESVLSLMAVERYLEKCALIAGLRRPYPQG